MSAMAKDKWYEVLVRIKDQRPLRQVIQGKSFDDVRDKAHRLYGQECLVQVVTDDNVRSLFRY